MGDDIFFRRDEKGNLTPEEITLDNGETILAIPLTRGEINRFKYKSYDDYLNYIILNNVKEPKFELSDLNNFRPKYLELIANKVLSISGLKLNSKKKVVDEDDFGKHLRKVRQERQEEDLILFLHSKGYTFFNVGRLIFSEINALISSFNREQKNRERDMKKGTKHKR